MVVTNIQHLSTRSVDNNIRSCAVSNKPKRRSRAEMFLVSAYMNDTQ